MNDTIAANRLMERCDTLATFTKVEGEITRPYGTPALLAAREQIAGWMHDAGMSTRIDNIGNLIGRYAAATEVASAKTFLIGGHYDSVINAGRYDGTLGILTGIEAVQSLHDSGTRFSFAVEVLAIVDEEGNRFRTSFLGSSPLAGSWNPDWLELTDTDDVTLRDAIIENGGDPSQLDSDALDPEGPLGFIEVHIEQGPVLQANDLPVAAVSSITGSDRATIVVRGMAGHAGTVPMNLRSDALAAAAEIVLAVERVGGAEPGLVATVGRMDVSPGAPNVIPGSVELTLDLRHADPVVRAASTGAIRDAVAAISDTREIEINWVDNPGFDGVACDPELTAKVMSSIEAEGHRATSLFSGAGHDALTIAAVAPVSMIFVRCKDGISHNPAESITAEDAGVAIRVLQRLLATLVSQGEG